MLSGHIARRLALSIDKYLPRSAIPTYGLGLISPVPKIYGGWSSKKTARRNIFGV
jgi:hypothetical protein